MVVLDGVYVKRGDGVEFLAAPAPTREALEVLVKRVVLRTVKWLKRKKYVREDLDSNEEVEITPLEALTQLAMERGTLVTTRDPDDVKDDEAAGPKKEGHPVTHLGFNLHASVTVAAHDAMDREPRRVVPPEASSASPARPAKSSCPARGFIDKTRSDAIPSSSWHLTPDTSSAMASSPR